LKRLESSYSKLDKILTLEQRTGFADQAVMGGLEPFLARWASEAHQESGPEHTQRIDDLIALFHNYGLATSGARQELVAQARDRLAQMNAEGMWRGRPVQWPQGASGEHAAGDPSRAGEPDHAPSDQAPVAAAGQTREEPTAPPQERDAGAGNVLASEHRVAGPLPIRCEGPAPQAATAAVPPRPRTTLVGLDSPVTVVPGISGAYSARFARLGVETVRDLLYLIPRRYNDFSAMRKITSLAEGETVTIAGTVADIGSMTTKRGLIKTTAVISDETGEVSGVWFNQPYIAQTLSKGRQVVLSGKVAKHLGFVTFTCPEYELLETEDLIHTGRLAPVYPLTEGIGARWLRRQQKKVVDRWAPEVMDHLPASVRQSAGLTDLVTALLQIHFPDDPAALLSARRRLAFDEFFLIQLGLLLRRHDWRDLRNGTPLRVDDAVVAGFLATLPYSLTAGQQAALGEILADLKQPTPMSRLLQGEVGSGKTVVAAAAARVALANGLQVAVMAPTEILAEQHLKTFDRLLGAEQSGETAPVVRLLTGSMRDADKAKTRQDIAAGIVDVVIGTQAVIQETVEFARLGLVVIDEQHRFGVMQRAALRQKGYSPHVLAMTATPIPRTLALTIYGDLDISVISELPPGRQTIRTYWLGPREREKAYTNIRAQVAQGRQAFVICPLVEDSEVLEVKSATEEHERLHTQIFPDLRLAVLHGRMKPAEKEAVMRSFRDGEIDVLVSTPVVEVGIDIPNATVMMIEGADRFGLSQLHQFRGRVGRGDHPSMCLLLCDRPSEEARARLGIIESTQDGFRLAEEDLKLRGPGEFFGVRQSGLPDLKVAKLGDVAILELARAEALKLFERDPGLEQSENRPLQQQVARFWQAKTEVS
jgi:ATP-dependent DNA helicase RecG